MKVGTLCYATNQGLGILAKSFYDNGIVTHPLLVKHGTHDHNEDWYPKDTPIINIRSFDSAYARDYVKTVDVMLFFETPFDWDLIEHCRLAGVKTVLMPMYECTPKFLPFQPDAFINPSHLDQQYFPNNGVHIPVPVQVPWKLRERARLFIHNAGHLGLKWRNGTLELLQSLKYSKSDFHLIVRGQDRELCKVLNAVNQPELSDPRLDIQIGNVPFDKLWDTGDVFIFPEKFNGLSLPLQEARAAGMLVMCGDRFPMNAWLPKMPLIPVKDYEHTQAHRRFMNIKSAIIDPVDIARTMDEWYDKPIDLYSRHGREYAENHSWEVLKPRYLNALQRVVEGRKIA